jgi:hypothetical protein
MNKWRITGNEQMWRIVKTELATKQANGFDAQKPMKLNEAMAYVATEMNMGDIIVLPNGAVLSVGFTPSLSV